MITDRIARGYFEQASYRINLVRSAARSKRWEVAVREAQETVELALKGALRLVTVEPPRWHDVGDVLQREAAKFPSWFAKQVDELVEISAWLGEKCALSFYGDEDAGIPASGLFKKRDGQQAYDQAKQVLRLVKRLFREFEKQKSR